MLYRWNAFSWYDQLVFSRPNISDQYQDPKSKSSLYKSLSFYLCYHPFAWTGVPHNSSSPFSNSSVSHSCIFLLSAKADIERGWTRIHDGCLTQRNSNTWLAEVNNFHICHILITIDLIRMRATTSIKFLILCWRLFRLDASHMWICRLFGVRSPSH